MKTLILIDGANFFAAQKLIGRSVDLLKMRKYFSTPERQASVIYYTAIKEDASGLNNLQKSLDWMEYNGIRPVTKKALMVGAGENLHLKGNMDIEIAVDALCLSAWVDHIVLFTGDGDFRYLIEELQRRGKEVTVCSVLATNTGYVKDAHMVADSLRRWANTFINLNEISGPHVDWFYK